MTSAIVLSCPVCGAPLQSSSHCSYCGSVVVIQTHLPRIDPATIKQEVVREYIHKYRADIRANARNEAAHYGLGIAYYNLGLNKQAIEELAIAAALTPENPSIRMQLVTLYLEIRRKTSARDELRAVLELDPQCLDALSLVFELDCGSSWGECSPSCFSILERMFNIDPNSIRKPVAKILNTPSDIRDRDHKMYYAADILLHAIQKWPQEGRNADPEHVHNEFIEGTVRDASRLLGALRYVSCVLQNRSGVFWKHDKLEASQCKGISRF